METITKQLSAQAGCYTPAFFDMFIDTDKPATALNLQSFNDHERSVFFHEYVHFMQDFMTVCGLSNIYCLNERFRLIACDYATQNPFYVPVHIKDNKGNVLLNITLNNLSWGGMGNLPTFQINGTSTTPINYYELMFAGISPFQYVELDTDQGKLGFGKREIMESMAYILQRLCTKIDYKSPEYPYCAAEKLAQHLCHTGFEKDPYNIVALCDVALMSSNPGFMFVYYLQRIDSGDLHVGKAEDIYDDYYKQKGVCNKKVMLPMEHFEMVSQMAKKALKSYIDIPQINTHLHPWIDLVFDTGLQIRQSEKYFFLTLARMGDIMSNTLFLGILDKVGTPLMHNRNNEYGRQKSNPDYGDIFQYITALLAVENIFNGIFTCPLINFCNQSTGQTKISVNESCLHAPWKRRNDVNLCPVAMIIKHRKLAVNEPTLKPMNQNL